MWIVTIFHHEILLQTIVNNLVNEAWKQLIMWPTHSCFSACQCRHSVCDCLRQWWCPVKKKNPVFKTVFLTYLPFARRGLSFFEFELSWKIMTDCFSHYTLWKNLFLNGRFLKRVSNIFTRCVDKCLIWVGKNSELR